LDVSRETGSKGSAVIGVSRETMLPKESQVKRRTFYFAWGCFHDFESRRSA
jgi:hypothetical protein